jgi:membrane fusion protein, copper/silver efflux system
MKAILKNKYIKGTIFVLAGLILGWILFHNSNKENTAKTEVKNAVVWTCSMDPQVRKDKPGKCPICGMDLIPLEQLTSKVNPDAVQLDEGSVELANVQTSIISKQKPVKEIRLYGKVQADERLVQTLTAHVPGRIEQLYISFTGDRVRTDQMIALIYSPELNTAQQELLEALKYKDSNPLMVNAAKEKLKQWKLSETQISDIETSRKVKENFEVCSTVNGTVINKRVNVGDHVSIGQAMFEVVDLSHIWVMFDAYESDLQWVKTGSQIGFSVQSIPDKEYSGTISFIDPVINPQTRVAKVRVEVSNTDGLLKPEMFATGSLRTVLSAENKLVVPKSAVLWTGEQSVVYVKDKSAQKPTYQRRTVKLGTETGNYFIVESGLDVGEEVVTNGTFAVDAAAQLSGKPSMMNNQK